MGLSANTLFHFTKGGFKSLTSILQNGLYPRCSMEYNIFKPSRVPIGIPMISFCDIRLSQLEKHINNYGKYGIGLTKSWGERNGVNPVFYIQKNSGAHHYTKLIENQFFQNNNSENDLSNLLKLLGYFKSGKAYLWNKERRKFNGTLIEFYDEREWRFIPYQEALEDFFYYKNFYFTNVSNLSKIDFPMYDYINEKLESYPLKFNLDNINYVVLEKNEDIKVLMKFIKSKQLFKGFEEEFASKITTVKRIKDDH